LASRHSSQTVCCSRLAPGGIKDAFQGRVLKTRSAEIVVRRNYMLSFGGLDDLSRVLEYFFTKNNGAADQTAHIGVVLQLAGFWGDLLAQ
jgi:hypothetical protein